MGRMMGKGRPSQASEEAARMLQMILTTKEDVMGCDECFELFDRCADLIASGLTFEDFYPQVKQHLEDCVCCVEEFDALLTALRAVPPSPPATSSGRQ